MSNVRLTALAAILLAGLLLGCDDDGEDSTGGRLVVGKSFVLVGPEGDGNNVAGFGVGGVVSMTGRCLGIDRVTVIWPHGTSVTSEDPLEIDVPGLGRVRLGDHVEGGGYSATEQLPEGISRVPESCPAGRVLAFFPEG